MTENRHPNPNVSGAACGCGQKSQFIIPDTSADSLAKAFTESESCCSTKALAKSESCCQIESSKHTPSCCHDGNQPKKFDYIMWGSLAFVVPFWIIGQFELFGSWKYLPHLGHAVHSMIGSMWWGVLLGAIAIGIIAKIPREFIMSVLGQGGTVSGLLRAVGAGILLDLCSHGILMIGTKFYERGASIGQVVAFLLASPWNSLSLTLILVGLIGFKWTVAFIILSMFIAVITGWIFDQLVARKVLPSNPHHITIPEGFAFWREAGESLAATRFDTKFFKDIIVTGIKDSQMVVRWLAFGVMLAALLRTFLNPEQFQHLFGPGIAGLAVTIFVATVLEVCSEGSAPIAADIVTRASAPGNGFAFLMAGVATDYTEVMVLKDTTRSWKIALFLPLISVPQVILVAWIINSLS